MNLPQHGGMGPVRDHLSALQDRLCAELEAQEESERRFREDLLGSPSGAWSRPRVLSGGTVLEKAAVHFSYTRGRRLPAAASERRPELAGRHYEAVSVSTIVHPKNPHVPTSHLNLRFFLVPGDGAEEALWWFGGGFDLTPYYGYEEDATAWHRAAQRACLPLGADAYPRYKRACDSYFLLPHRREPRGIGGIFFDDLCEGDFERCFAFVRRVGEAYCDVYLSILRRRKALPWGERERAFQLFRRGRYAEFNLVWDRGTRFGLESGGRVESILASLPPLAAWPYDYRPEPGSPEEQLTEYFLKPRDWASASREARARSDRKPGP